nr:zinc finger protein 2-like [Monopterus albus]
MSFLSTFGTQVAAIMDVLAKAAVAEITKLVEDGTLVLRLELCQRDGEIRELRRSLKLMEAELSKAQEAAITRITEDRPEETSAGSQVSPRAAGEKEAQQTCAVHLEPTTADTLCKPRHGTEEGWDMRPVVKHEPTDEPEIHETTDSNVCFVAGEQDDLMWPHPVCSMFDKTCVAIQQHIQTFPSHTEQFPTHRDRVCSYNSSSTTAEEIADDSLIVPAIVDTRPLCMGKTTSDSGHNEQFRHVSCPALSQTQCLQPALQQAGLSLAPSHAQRSTADTEDHIFDRNNLRTKRLMRPSQKLFICPVCNKVFPYLSKLEEHKCTLHQWKPFRCLECGKSFTQKTRLKTHQSVHTGARPFSCKVCGKVFSRQDNCLRHERFHNKMKLYSCSSVAKASLCQET